jgi:hypothetical protein
MVVGVGVGWVLLLGGVLEILEAKSGGAEADWVVGHVMAHKGENRRVSGQHHCPNEPSSAHRLS